MGIIHYRYFNAKETNIKFEFENDYLLYAIGEDGKNLEFNSMSDCKLYGQRGELIKEVKPQGKLPNLVNGLNRIKFTCDSIRDVSSRVNVTIISKGNFI